jgi:hypothetical protein
MVANKDTKESDNPKIQEEITISNPLAIPILFHEKKGMILKLLIEKEMTIIDLKLETGLNPGTIKRHIDDLLQYDLVFISRTQISEQSVVMKFYRAKAKKYNFDIKWP